MQRRLVLWRRTSAIPLLEQSKQWELEARSYNLMAITSVTKGNKSIAMDYYLSGVNICRKHGIHNVERSITLNLGSLYLGNEIYEEARVYFLRAMEAYEASEKEAKNPAGLLNRKLLSLKMRYYKAKHMEEEFKESAVSFYEQTEILEKDSRSMIASMLRVRGHWNRKMRQTASICRRKKKSCSAEQRQIQ